LYPKIGHHFTIAVGGLRDLPISLTAFGLGGAGLVFTAAGVLRRFWRTDAVPLVIAALTGAGLLVVGGLAHPVEPMQISVRVIVLTIVAFCWIERAIAARGLARPARSVLAALGIVLATYAVARVVKRQAGGHLIREAHRAGTVWVARAMDDVTWLEANTAEGEPVFAFPDKGGLYFLSRTRNVTSYPVLLDQGFHTESQVTEAIRQIAASCATVGIWDRTRLASGVHHQDWFTLKPLYQAILRDYAIVAELPNGAYGLRRTTSCDLRDPRSD
jgi:hypothetical protein